MQENNNNVISNLSAIFALDINNGFSKNGKIPWNNKIDMNFFRSKTINKTIIMGYNTLISLPKEEPLAKRHNIIITTKQKKDPELIKYSNYTNIIFLNLEEAIQHITTNLEQDFIVIGGIQIFNLFSPYISKIWLTRFKHDYNCDIFYNINDLIQYYHYKSGLYDDDTLVIYEMTR
jgi:dihydrofolate reductase